MWNNVITIAGMYLAVISVILLVTFALFHVVSTAQNAYVDIVGFLIIPSMLVVSLIMMPVGILIKSWRIHRRDPSQHVEFHFPKIDLSDFQQRRVAKIFVISTLIFLPVMGVSSYHGYHYTDSTQFCAQACHSVMEPQAVAYAKSPHARVVCAECHIGEGAGWFVKSKLSGTRQVLAMWQESYSRPIPSAIHHLRPARETCEQCHWPDKFYGAQLKQAPHFAPDENNTDRTVTMLLRIGGGTNESGPVEGIHWHLAPQNSIEYVATDDRLTEIPWIRIRDKSGKEHIFRSDGRPSSDPPPDGPRRTLDCMDCHNRPAHNFLSPQTSVDRFLHTGLLDRTLPYIKREAVRVLSQPYPDRVTAEETIGRELEDFYRTNYTEVWQDRQIAVFQAIDAVRNIHRSNFFPYMKVDWRTYPDNIGHMISSGCFRCHDNKHVNQDGKVLATDCNLCHSFMKHIERDDGSSQLIESQFEHSMPLTGVHAMIRCDQCHDGGVLPPTTCEGCHADTASFIDATSAEFAAFNIEPDSMADTMGCEDCHDVSAPIDVDAMNETCLECHDDDEDRFDGMVIEWKKEVHQLLSQLGNDLDPKRTQTLGALHRAGPLHNMEATRAIIKQLRESPTAMAPAPPAEE
jgi:hypothetical protein